MKKIVILLSGKMKSGKNELANHLEKEFTNFGLDVKLDYFAHELKENCAQDFKKLESILNEYYKRYKNIEFKTHYENWFEKKTPITRAILQIYGTEIFRNRVDDNWWVNKLKEKILWCSNDVFLITDCRFPNEILNIYDNNYLVYTIRLTRDINKGKTRNHISETALDNWKDWNYLIDNHERPLSELIESSKEIAKDIYELSKNF